MKRVDVIAICILVAVLAVYGITHQQKAELLENYLEQGFNISEEPTQEETAAQISATTTALKIPIFIYHSVRPHIPGESKWQDAYDITPQLLEAQLAYLQSMGYTTISLDDLARDIEAGTTSPIAKPVVLTFDDGWQNQYRYAFPILKKYHARATFYIFTNPIGQKPHFLTWKEIKEMDAAGMTIGAHTLSHPYLNKLTTNELAREIIDGKKIIEEHLGKPVVHFASPFGYSDPNIISIVKSAGFKTARTTYKGAYHTKDDMFKLRGFLVNDSMGDFVNVLNQ